MNSLGKYDVLRVTPTISGDTYANNDILWDSTEITDAVLGNGGSSLLINAMIVSKSLSLFDCEIFFMARSQSIGTINAERNISDTDFAAGQPLGRLTLDSSINNYNYGGGRVHNFIQRNAASNDQWNSQFPIVLSSNASSSSVYCFALISGTDVTPDFGTDDITLILGVQKR